MRFNHVWRKRTCGMRKSKMHGWVCLRIWLGLWLMGTCMESATPLLQQEPPLHHQHHQQDSMTFKPVTRVIYEVPHKSFTNFMNVVRKHMVYLLHWTREVLKHINIVWTHRYRCQSGEFFEHNIGSTTNLLNKTYRVPWMKNILKNLEIFSSGI